MNFTIFLQTMTEYFLGEKIEALVFILPIGLLSLVFGGWLITEGGSFFKGVAIPFLFMGLVMTVVGGVVGYRTPKQVADLRIGFESTTNETQNKEKQRIDQVNKAWFYYLVVWLIFGVAGLGLRFLTHSDFMNGLGIALVFFSGVALLIDGFAERRAKVYSEALNSNLKNIERVIER